MATEMKQMSVSVPDDVYENLLRISAKGGRSISHLACHLLEVGMTDWIKLHGKPPLLPEPKENDKQQN